MNNIFNNDTSMKHAGELAAVGESTQQRVIEIFRINAKRKRVTKTQVEEFRSGFLAKLDSILPARIADDGQPESDKKRKAWLSGRVNQYLNRTRITLAREEITVWKSAKGGKNSGNSKADDKAEQADDKADDKAEQAEQADDKAERVPRHELTPTPQAALDCLSSAIAGKSGSDAGQRKIARRQLEKVAAFLGLDC